MFISQLYRKNEESWFLCYLKFLTEIIDFTLINDTSSNRFSSIVRWFMVSVHTPVQGGRVPSLHLAIPIAIKRYRKGWWHWLNDEQANKPQKRTEPRPNSTNYGNDLTGYVDNPLLMERLRRVNRIDSLSHSMGYVLCRYYPVFFVKLYPPENYGIYRK